MQVTPQPSAAIPAVPPAPMAPQLHVLSWRGLPAAIPDTHATLCICLRGTLDIETVDGPFALGRRRMLTLPPDARPVPVPGSTGLGLLVSLPPLLLAGHGGARGRRRAPAIFACRSTAPAPVLDQTLHLLRHGATWSDDLRLPRALQLVRQALAAQNDVHAWLQRVPGRSDTHRRNTLQRLLRARNAILNTPFEDHDLESLSHTANYSKSHFLRTFRDVFGETPGELLTGARIAMAKSLMSDGAMGISEIAADVGYASRCAFSRMFKNRVGESASNFRRRLGESIVFATPLVR